MVFIYTICPTVKSAESLGRSLLEAKLVACYNLWPIRSRYWWQGQLVASRETALLLKTAAKKQLPAKRMIEKLHPYDVPCVAAISTRQLNTAYAKWLNSACK